MLPGQDHQDRLVGDDLVGDVRLGLEAAEAEVDLAPLDGLADVRGEVAGNAEVDVLQLVAQHLGDIGQPLNLLAGEEAHRKAGLGRADRPPGGRHRVGRGLQGEAGMFQEGLTGGGELDAPGGALEQLGADLQLQVAQLAAQGGLGGVQPPLGGKGQAALLGHGDEVPEVT